MDVRKSALFPIMFTRTRYGVRNVGFGLWGLGLEFETLSFTNDVKVMPDTSTSRVTRHASYAKHLDDEGGNTDDGISIAATKGSKGGREGTGREKYSNLTPSNAGILRVLVHSLT